MWGGPGAGSALTTSQPQLSQLAEQEVGQPSQGPEHLTRHWVVGPSLPQSPGPGLGSSSCPWPVWSPLGDALGGLRRGAAVALTLAPWDRACGRVIVCRVWLQGSWGSQAPQTRPGPGPLGRGSCVPRPLQGNRTLPPPQQARVWTDPRNAAVSRPGRAAGCQGRSGREDIRQRYTSWLGSRALPWGGAVVQLLPQEEAQRFHSTIQEEWSDQPPNTHPGLEPGPRWPRCSRAQPSPATRVSGAS